jgi:hypothetical protein
MDKMALTAQRLPSFGFMARRLLPAMAGVAAAVGYAAWTRPEIVPEPIPVVVVQPDPAAKAESSFSYTFSLAKLLEERCGKVDMQALAIASDAEKRSDLGMVARAWTAATKRAQTITTTRSCDHIREEIAAGVRRAEKAGYWSWPTD